MSRKPRKPLLDQHGDSEHPEPRKGLATLLKAVGVATAIISLILGLNQVTKLVSDVRERRRHVAEVYATGKEEQGNGDYQAAWTSFEQALKSADEGGQIAKATGQLGAERRQLREAQEDLAMAWLRNIRVAEGEKFSDVVEKLVPVLARGVSSASGIRKADLLAHSGWAYFLKGREGPGDSDPEQHYRRALEIDPGNPYAHAPWGHWIIWKNGNLDDATRHFSAAVASRRDLPYVRRIQLAALRDHESTEGEFLRVVNDMRKNNEKIDARTRSYLNFIYYVAFNAGKDFQKLTAVVPATEQIATIQALFYDADFEQSKILREAYLATLQEAAGHREAALKTWLAMRASLPAEISPRVVSRADAAIKRLSERPK